MSNYKILMYEDDGRWKTAFEFNLEPKFKQKGKDLAIYHREDNSTLIEDLEWLPDLIMIDYDLVHLTGDDIIQAIDNDPNYKSVKVFFYSGGESIETLQEISKTFKCSVRCFTKEGDDLETAILSLI